MLCLLKWWITSISNHSERHARLLKQRFWNTTDESFTVADEAVTLTLADLDVPRLAGADVTLALDGLGELQGALDLVRETRLATLSDGRTLSTAGFLLTAEGVELTLDVPGSGNGQAVAITGADLALALLEDASDSAGANPERWLALRAVPGTLSLGGYDLALTSAAVEINRAFSALTDLSSQAATIDWSASARDAVLADGGTLALDFAGVAGGTWRLPLSGGLTIGGQTFTADLVAGLALDASGDAVIGVSVANASASLEAGLVGVGLSGGSGALLFHDDGMAGHVAADVAVTGLDALTLGGAWALDFNTMGRQVTESVATADGAVEISLAAGEAARLAGSDVTLAVAGLGELSGALQLISDARTLTLSDGATLASEGYLVSGSGLSAGLRLPGAGDAAAVVLAETDVLFSLYEDVSAGVGATPDQWLSLAGLPGSLTVAGQTLDVSSAALSINRAVSALDDLASTAAVIDWDPAPLERVAGSATLALEMLGASGGSWSLPVSGELVVEGQRIGADFTFGLTLVDGTAALVADAANVRVVLTAGGAGLELTGSGALLVTDAGLAGRVDGSLALTGLDGFDLSGDLGLALNTFENAVATSFDVAGRTVSLDLDAGEAVRLSGAVVSLDVAGVLELSGGLDLVRETRQVTLSDGAVREVVGYVLEGSDLTAALRAPGAPDAYGVVLTGADLLLSLYEDAAAGLADPERWLSLVMAPETVTIAGQEIDVRAAAVELNRAWSALTDLDAEAAVIDWAAAPMAASLRPDAGQALAMVGAAGGSWKIPVSGDIQAGGSVLSGDLTFELGVDGTGGAVYLMTAENLSTSLDAGLASVELSEGSATLAMLADGWAGSLGGTVRLLGLDGFTLGGSMEVGFNTLGGAYDETIALGGRSVALASAAGAGFRIAGDNVQLAVDGVGRLQGALELVQDARQVTLSDGAVRDVSGFLLAGSEVDLSLDVPGVRTLGATLHDADLVFSFLEDVSAGVGVDPDRWLAISAVPARLTVAGYEADLSEAALTLNRALGSVTDLAGQAAVIDWSAAPTTVSAGTRQMVLDAVGGAGGTWSLPFSGALSVEGQSLEGDFILETGLDASGRSLFMLDARNVAASVNAGPASVTLTNGSGVLMAKERGWAGRIEGTVGLSGLSGLTLSGNLDLELNTVGAQVAETLTVGGRTHTLKSAAGEALNFADVVRGITARVVSVIDAGAGNDDEVYGDDQLLGRRQMALIALAERLEASLGVPVTLHAGEQIKAADAAAAAVASFQQVTLTVDRAVAPHLGQGTRLSVGARITGEDLELGFKAGPMEINVDGGWAVLDGDGDLETVDHASYTVVLDQQGGSLADDGRFHIGQESIADNIVTLMHGTLDVQLPMSLTVSGITVPLAPALAAYTESPLLRGVYDINGTWLRALNGDEQGLAAGNYDARGNRLGDFTPDMMLPTGGYVIHDGSDAVQFDMSLGQHLLGTGMDLPLDLDFPGMEMNLDGGFSLTADWAMDLGLGVSTRDGFYMTTNAAEADPELRFDVNVFLDGTPRDPEHPAPFTGSGRMLFLELDAVDSGREGFNGFMGSGLTGRAHVDIQGNDRQRLTFNDALGGSASKLFDTGFEVDGDLRLDLELGLAGGAGGLPDLVGDLVMDWDWKLGDRVERPTISLENFGVKVDSYVTDFLQPLAKEIKGVLEPFEPIIDALNQTVPGLSDLGVRNTMDLIDTLMVLTGKPPIDWSFVKAAEFMLDFPDQLKSWKEAGTILLGNIHGFETGQLWWEPASSGDGGKGAADVAKKDPKDVTAKDLESMGVSSSLAGKMIEARDKAMAGGKTPRAGLQIVEHLTNIENWMNLLSGKDATLFTYEMPVLDFKKSVNVPIIGYDFEVAEIGVFAFGDIYGYADLAFGYDTKGIRQALDTGNPLDAFDGFYVSDYVLGTSKEKDEFGLEVDLGLKASVIADTDPTNHLVPHETYGLMVTGTITTLQDDALLEIASAQDVIIRGNINVNGSDSDLLVQSDLWVYLDGHANVQRHATVLGGMTRDGAGLFGADGRGSSVYFGETGLINTFQAGSAIDIRGDRDVDIFGAVVAGAVVGASGTTWTGEGSTITVTSGEQLQLGSGLMASGDVILAPAHVREVMGEGWIEDASGRLSADVTLDVALDKVDFQVRAAITVDDGDTDCDSAITLTSNSADVTLDGAVTAWDAVTVRAGADVNLEGTVRAGHLIDVAAGTLDGSGSVIAGAKADLETTLGSDVLIAAGASGGDVTLAGSRVQTGGGLALTADAGAIAHSGGLMGAASVTASSLSGFSGQLATSTAAISVTGAGDVFLINDGTLSLTATVTNGALSGTVYGNLTLASITLSGGGEEDDLALSVLDPGAIGEGNLAIGTLTVAGLGDASLEAYGAMSQTGAGAVVADALALEGRSNIDLTTEVNQLSLVTRADGDVTLTDLSANGLLLKDVRIQNGGLTFAAAGQTTIERLWLETNTNNAALTSAVGIAGVRNIFADANIRAHNLTLDAGSGVADLTIEADELTRVSATSGDIVILDLDPRGAQLNGLVVKDVVTGGGDVTLTSDGNMTVEGVDATGGSIALTTLKGNLLVLDTAGADTLNAGSGVVLDAGGELRLDEAVDAPDLRR